MIKRNFLSLSGRDFPKAGNKDISNYIKLFWKVLESGITE